MKNINTKQWNYLERINERETFSQAYLFSGSKGVGKMNTVFDFICLLNDIKNKDQVRNLQHPDVLVVKPIIEENKKKKRKKDISIEQVQKAVKRASYYSYEERFKFIVIAEAERLTTSAANSLLKFIESPTKDTIICLVTNNEERVLPTIKSRCQPVRFSLQQDEEIAHNLMTRLSEEEQVNLDDCVVASHGRVEFAMNYCRNKELRKTISEQQDSFRKALRGGLIRGFALSESLHKDKEILVVTIDEWIWFLRDFLRKGIKNNQDKEITKKVLGIMNELVKLKASIEQENVNPRIQLDNFFVQLT